MKWKEQPYRQGHGGYVSEFEQFINGYMASHPDVERDRLKGWYIWWDHKVDVQELERNLKDKFPMPPYYAESAVDAETDVSQAR